MLVSCFHNTCIHHCSDVHFVANESPKAFVVQQAANDRSLAVQVRNVFKLLLVLCFYNPELDAFTPLPDMPADTSVQICDVKKALDLIDEGQSNLKCTL